MTVRCVATGALAVLLALAGCGGGVGVGLGGSSVGSSSGVSLGVGAGPFGVSAGNGFLGVFAGTGAGPSIQETDALLAQGAAQRGLEYERSGTATTWYNAENGHSGTFTPLNSYRAPDGPDCRDYEQSIIAGGQSASAKGTACRGPQGAWKVSNPR